ncbi:DEAD/DEAH box helicase [Sanguibacter suaedae]|uniref:DEAD/DEAH box helicase n=1 Tax=Sanguibacter suaedae TaxID=2795737 RepID=A0A934IA44_9MICO|nr:DEAD/DEAH box helicase [Sanguibacter suaedae]MBI9114980.1 DEAD/DEAH box helicase [Sanguibacter suaedae]
MSELLPTRQAEQIQSGLLDYLTTTFALADADARRALHDFLTEPASGIFKGPYLRLRLPFQPAPPGWDRLLSWELPYPPYRHQAEAFSRLVSITPAGQPRRPEPTLVTTGTGSGKTEAFLFPILDHVLRARRNNTPGIKALILYPMNALANDQAARLAELITTRPELAGVTAALYTGQQDEVRTVVTAEGLITDRVVIRDTPPDILLTNYKMLDQLLLRHEDHHLWQQSATSLQYLVLDEFHTYDGAQGTDVAMLLRRLGITLKASWPTDAHALDAAGLSAEDHARPLGRITPIATSATLGDKGDPQVMLDFATTVFGETFDATTVVGESRLTLDGWADAAAAHRVRAAGLSPVALADLDHPELIEKLDAVHDSPDLATTFLAAAFGVDQATLHALIGAGSVSLLDLAKAHPAVQQLVRATSEAQALDVLADELFLEHRTTITTEHALAMLVHLTAALSHVRAISGRPALTVDLHMWVRELTRIDRVAAATTKYLWSDDGGVELGESDAFAWEGRPAFPALYCRHCGRSGWGVELAPVGHDLHTDDTSIRRNHASRKGRFRALLFAPGEADHSLFNEAGPDPETTNLAWLHVRQRTFLTAPPADDDPDLLDGWILPVLTQVGPDADDLSMKDHCPSCQQRDGIRFLGSAIATLLSVTLSTLFGDAQLDAAEKKALVFTDSVQDAAHRAGFVEARSHTLTMRAVLRAAVGDMPRSVDEIVDEAMRQAGDDPFRRYRMLHPDLVDTTGFKTFWTADRQLTIPVGVRKNVRRRVLFDTILEVGLFSRIGRTLEATGSVAIGVEAGTPARLATIGRRVLTDGSSQEHLGEGLVTVGDADLVRWVRGTLERMRERGAIQHEWFAKYIGEDGNRYRLWGGRTKNQGMPAFPPGRSAPAFPRTGPATGTKDPLLDSVTSPQSWYTQWTARTLSVPVHFAGVLARQLLDALTREGVLTALPTKTGTVYAIPASGVVVHPTTDEDLAAGRHLLVCDTCRHQVPVTVEVHGQMDGAPCMLGRCPGRIRPERQDTNFYRTLYASADMRRIVAREHSSLLDDETRLRYENEFKVGEASPDAPNVLVATPTLEMGIDIGDLSTVLLSSLPRTVASYLQRIGRAGRLTGNALSLAFVTGRGEHLPRLGDPLSMINGQVRPPATYLSAEEILRRQYTAHLVDAFARDRARPHPKKATAAISKTDPGTFLGELATVAETEAEQRLDTFLGAFSDLGDDAVALLRRWATPSADTGSSGIRLHLETASARWNLAVQDLKHQIAALEKALPKLNVAADLPAANDDDKAAAKSAAGTLRLLRAQLKDLRGDHWIAVLEEYGILPNYTLLDDSVTLDVALTWIDPDSGKFESEAYDYQRSSANALRELAPGSTFYARGMEIVVDTVDLGPDGQDVRDWSLCPCCGYAQEIHTTQPAPTQCPRCLSLDIADAKQRVRALELRRVSAEVRRDEAAISDARDERVRQRYSIVVAADIDPTTIVKQWFVDGYDFGVKYLSHLDVRWFNTGKLAGLGSTFAVAGNECPVGGFRVCAACGHLSSGDGTNNTREHKPWCVYRTSAQESTVDLMLSRSLRTQGLVIRLPHSVTSADTFAEPSLSAAVMLGLRERLGGSPDHITVSLIADPLPPTAGGPGGQTARALLLHDSVPGGTGYLAGLSDHHTMWDVLTTAWQILRDCPCSQESRLACHRCLLPFADNRPDTVSRTVAERHLRDILLGGTPGPDGQDDDPHAVAPGDASGWNVTEIEPPSGAHASPLEIRFRTLFTRRLQALGATVKELPGPHGNTLQITIPGGQRRWSFEPELPLGPVKPDFVLRCDDPNVPRVAIFTDGHFYHASPTHNIIAVDSEKRAGLRDEGYVVLALTHADLEASETAGAGVGSGHGLAPSWLSSHTVEVLMEAGFTFPPSAVEAANGGAIGFLMAWIQKTDTTGTRQLADTLPWFFAPMADQCMLDADTPLETHAAHHLLGEPDITGTTAAWRWREGPLVLLARAQGEEQTSNVELAILLDDRDEAVTGPDHRAAWQRWIHLSNAINLRTHTTVLGALSQIDLGATGTPAASLGQSPRVDLAHEWRVILEADPAATGGHAPLSASEREVLVQLERAGLPAPEVGEEVEDGIPVFVCWPTLKVALDHDLDHTDRTDLVSAGWTVLPLDSPTLSDALLEK